MNRRLAQGEATRRQLLDVAARLFAEQGYEDTSIEQVLRQAGVSRGSLYHHYDSKEQLFEAVVEDVEQRIAEELMTVVVRHRDPVQVLRARCARWIALAEDPAVRRIILTDAPAVLGWQRWREIDERHGFGLLKHGVADVASAGRLAAGDVDVVAHVLLGGLNEAAMLVARAENPVAARRQATKAVDRLIDGFLRSS
ncbi:MAG: TetR/AcrR family transcriptional regulator [Acidimicrobiia bacterium]|nr:TetR/AcrR family transcriptional regulator [Acidimicrobiia bacterium]